eukprot:jgi/Botrbrau1/8122/Bobra.0308s0015.1
MGNVSAFFKKRFPNPPPPPRGLGPLTKNSLRLVPGEASCERKEVAVSQESTVLRDCWHNPIHPLHARAQQAPEVLLRRSCERTSASGMHF